jgi:hypothetical protein
MSQNNGELKMKQMKNYFYHRSNQKIAALVCFNCRFGPASRRGEF